MPLEIVISPYALTTLEHVKSRLTMTVDTNDTVLIRLINSATDQIERMCGLAGNHHFVQTTYTNEIYSVQQSRQIYLILRAGYVLLSGLSFNYRAGTVTAPNWTAFIPDQYELKNPQPIPNAEGNELWSPSGIIRIYGVLPRLQDNMLQVTYTAGFPVSWDNEGDNDTHLLPAALTQLCDDLVVRWWKRRTLAGQTGESLQGQTVSNWKDMMDDDDKQILNAYKRLQFF